MSGQNAGINGNLAWNVLQRLDDVVACRPDAVILLVGTNDVLGTLGPGWESMYRRQQHIPATPTLAWYRESLRATLGRLSAETGARVAVLDLPPIGEDLGSPTNDLVRRYNAAIRELAAEAGATVLPLHDRLAALLPPDHAPPPFDGTRRLMGVALARREARRQVAHEVKNLLVRLFSPRQPPIGFNIRVSGYPGLMRKAMPNRDRVPAFRQIRQIGRKRAIERDAPLLTKTHNRLSSEKFRH